MPMGRHVRSIFGALVRTDLKDRQQDVLERLSNAKLLELHNYFLLHQSLNMLRSRFEGFWESAHHSPINAPALQMIRRTTKTQFLKLMVILSTL